MGLNMTGNQVIVCIEDDLDDIEKLLSHFHKWSDELFEYEWNAIENSGSTSVEYYKTEKDLASARNYERHLAIEKLRARLLCE